MTNYVAPVSGTWAAKGSSPFKAARSGGHRYHAGNDLQARNGTPAVAAVGGTVVYAGHNQGYQWNAVVIGDDGNAFRYATHGPLSVKVGQRVEQGDKIGEIARGHLHFEVIPGGTPTFNAMVANPGQFVSTKYMPGHSAVTTDPAQLFGAKAGQRIAAGQALGGGALSAPQTAQSAIASLVAPSGGTQVPEMPSPLMSFNPSSVEAASLNGPPSLPPAFDMADPALALPPQFARAAAFPIDDELIGASAQDVLDAGPRPNPRSTFPVSAPVGPTTRTGVLEVGPRPRPDDVFFINPVSGAPDAGSVRLPTLNPRNMIASAPVGPTTAQGVLDMGPPMRPGGAPTASRVPAPPSNPRRDPFGFPIDVSRPRLSNPDGSFSTEQTITFNASEVGLPDEIVTVPTIINGQKVSDQTAMFAFARGLNPAVQRGFDTYDEADRAAIARTESIARARATNGERQFPAVWGQQPDAIASTFPARPEVIGSLPAAAAPSRSAAIQGIIDQGISDPNEIWGYLNLDRDGNLVGDITTNEIHAVLDRGGYRAPDATAAIADEFGPGLPTFGGPQSVSTAPNFEVRPASFQTPFAGRPEVSGSLPAAPFRPTNMEPASAPIMADPLFGIDRELADSMDRMRSERESLNLANDIGFTRRLMEPSTPAFRPPPDATMGERFDAANAFPNAGQMFSLPSLNGASFPAPPPRIGTVEAGSTGGEFFSPPPSIMPPSPDLMAGRFDDAFAPAVPGMIADLPGAYAARQGAQDGINSVFGAPPVPAAPSNLAIPFAEVPGFGAQAAEASPITRPLPPPSITPADFDARFGGGSVIKTPQPGQPGVVSGTMPEPMDIRSPAQMGTAPMPAPAMTPPPAPARDPQATQAEQKKNTPSLFRGPVGGLLHAVAPSLFPNAGQGIGGGLAGPAGGLLGFIASKNPPSFTPGGASGTAPNSSGGTVNWQHGTVGNNPGMQYVTSSGRTITTTVDPFTGQTITGYS